LTGTFAAGLTLHAREGTTTVAALAHTQRPLLLDLADRPDLRETAGGWQHRIDIHTVGSEGRPADALLIRPDAYVAWAATVDEPIDAAAPSLREALSHWFGEPDDSRARPPRLS
jgi:hypothetical protein